MPRSRSPHPTLSEEGPRPPAARWLGRLLVLVLVLAVGYAGYVGIERLTQAVQGPRCEATAGGTTFTWATDQASNAAVITSIGLRRGLPARAATIALATAMQESKVRNIRFGDRDSLGLFQQRPSQGWGTAEQIMNPEYSTNKFYDALVKVKGWQDMDIAQAAQAVQRSADGSYYAQHEAQARVTASTLAGYSPAGFACALSDPERPGTAADVAALLTTDQGLSGDVRATTLTVTAADERQAWAVAHWAVARAVDTGVTSVTVGSRSWRRTLADSALTWREADRAVAATTVVISVG